MNKNSALIWLPIVEKLGITSPKTKIIHYDHREIAGAMEDGTRSQSFPILLSKTTQACVEIGWPCFIRTDLSSAKHSGPTHYLACTPNEVRMVLLRTIEDNEMKFWLNTEGPQAILVREFLDLDASFRAFHNHPIAREWRFFVQSKEPYFICAHPYWPHEAIQNPTLENWEIKLTELHKKPDCFDELIRIAILVVANLEGGSWSVDFAMDVRFKWWLIDMATKENSWHWPGCKFAPRED